MVDLAALKRWTYDTLGALADGADPATAYHDDAHWWGSHPLNERKGVDAIRDVWATLRAAMPDMQRHTSILVAGRSAPDSRMPTRTAGRDLVAWMGSYQGTFDNDLLGIPATHGVVHLRACEVHHVIDGKIAHSYVLWDFLDLMRQAGVWPIAPSLGAEGAWPGPATADGLRLDTHDAARGEAAMATVLAMHAAMSHFDGLSVDSMPQAQYWAEHFMWYGPSGIGATRGMRGFRSHHQIPFLIGFRDRKGAGHYVRIADGDYVVTGGWPSVVATHTGEWLGIPRTGKAIGMRVMDFYRVQGDKIYENWIPIDIIHILLQMGVDVFARLAHLRGTPVMQLPPASPA